jgi:CheY-like chemotaxis protein
MKSKMVLVVEDDHNLQESIRRLVERCGYRVVSVRSLAEAHSTLKRIARPCLILLDTLMKEGLEAMAQLSAQHALVTIPVRLSTSKVRRMSKRSVHLDLLREALLQHCGATDVPPERYGDVDAS